jgi:cell division septation protein DedD
MPSTYTGSGIELIGDGEQSGSWGNTTNNNLEIVNRLVSEAGTITLAGTTHTLSIADGTLSDGQYAVLVFGGAPSGTNTVTLSPNDAKRVFFVYNLSGESVVLTQGSGGSVTVLNGKTAVVYSNGLGSIASVVNVSNGFIPATLTDIGALTPTDGNFIVGNGSTWVAETGNTVLNSIGVTATTAELNVLDGITASTAELNYTDGVTSSIQTQLNNKQPLDAELTAIAALATTDGNIIVGNGSTWVAESGATARTSLGLGSIATQNSNAVTITGGSISGITDIAVADGGTGASTAANARTNLGVAIGTDVQAWDANLDQIAALTPTDGNFIVGNGSAWVVETGDTVLNSIGVTATTTELNVLDGITATTVELNYTDGVTSNIQTQLDDKQPLDADLTAIGALAKTDGNFIVGNGSTWVAESGNTVLQSIGVTATTTELNIMDGVTATTAELNILDGVTATAAELNFTDGVTSNIQTQLNTKAATATSITAGAGLTGGGDLTANRTLSHADTSSQGSVNNSGTTFIQDVTLDTYGHVTGLASATVTLAEIGVGQTWQIVSRTDGTQYQNTTGKPIMVMVQGNSVDGIRSRATAGGTNILVSGGNNNNFICTHTAIIPDTWYYTYSNSSGSKAELR